MSKNSSLPASTRILGDDLLGSGVFKRRCNDIFGALASIVQAHGYPMCAEEVIEDIGLKKAVGLTRRSYRGDEIRLTSIEEQIACFSSAASAVVRAVEFIKDTQLKGQILKSLQAVIDIFEEQDVALMRREVRGLLIKRLSLNSEVLFKATYANLNMLYTVDNDNNVLIHLVWGAA